MQLNWLHLCDKLWHVPVDTSETVAEDWSIFLREIGNAWQQFRVTHAKPASSVGALHLLFNASLPKTAVANGTRARSGMRDDFTWHAKPKKFTEK